MKKNRFTKMLSRVFQSKQTYWDIQDTFSPQNFRFFESVVLGWKLKTLHMWAIDTLKDKFKADFLREEVRRRSSVFNSVVNYFKSNRAELEQSRVDVLRGHFQEFDALFQEEQNRLFHSSDTSVNLQVGLARICIADGADKVVLNVHGSSLEMQTNECFKNYEFTIKSMDGSEDNATRSGSTESLKRRYSADETVSVAERGVSRQLVHS